MSNHDFNYPTMNRKDLMSLSTINTNDAKTRKFKQVDTNRDWSTALYNLDIAGSAPKKFGVFHHKTDFINKVDDIERTSPKILHYPFNKPEYNLTCKDIAWASPQSNRNFITTRNLNPLEPKYSLPKVEEISAPVPKFIRDHISVDGIEGAHPRKYFQWETRKMFDNSAIKGSSPKQPYVRQTQYSNIDYSDVTRDVFKTKRCIDPLDPVYEVRYKDGENYSHGHIEGSKPVTNSLYVYKDPCNLKTTDIEGTAAGSKNRLSKYSGLNYNLNTHDFRGASASTLKKGIVTQRQTNPLDPNYELLGGKDISGGNNPYGNTLFSKKVNHKVITGKEIKGSTQVKVENKIEKVKASKDEHFYDNCQVYEDDKVEFDSEKFKKPQPYYGMIRDTYIVPTESFTSSGQLMAGGNKGKIVTKQTNQTNQSNQNKKSSSVHSINSSNTGASNFNEFSKQTYAQLLDKFIQKNPEL